MSVFPAPRKPGGRQHAAWLCAALLCAPAAASAQDFNQAITFGDSTVDSGAYKGLTSPGGGKALNDLWAAAVAANAGKPTSSPGLVSSEALAAMFGLTAAPAAQPGATGHPDIPGEPGGTNYATSGARSDLVNNSGEGLFTAAVPITQQINNYLTTVGGHANGNALYLVSGGGNDVSFAEDQTRSTAQFPIFGLGSAEADQYITDQAKALAGGVTKLSGAGARYIVVPDLPFSFPIAAGAQDQRDDRLLYSQTLWSGLAAAGVNFIPADINAVRLAIAANPAAFGFEFIDTNPNHTACTQPDPTITAYALLCSNSPGAPSQLANPTADQTRLFADAEGHLSTAGQKIFADYFYSLIVAPSQVSMLAETAVKTRLRLISDIQTQIEAGQQQPAGSRGLNAWAIGDIGPLAMDAAHSFPNADGIPRAAAAGLSARLPGGVVIGGAVAVGSLDADFSGAHGGFNQDEVSGSAYAAFLGSPLWATVIGTYGTLDYDVNRVVPIGITLQNNAAQTSGRNISVAAQTGYDYRSGTLKHGPVAGIAWQRVDVDGFTETGGFTSLSFGDQTRDSLVSMLGYRASLDWGAFHPFAQVMWNHELASTDREVFASLTTTTMITAPAYHMPALVLGSDWGTAMLGTTINLGTGVSVLTAFSADFGQDDVVSYGGKLGLNVAF